MAVSSQTSLSNASKKLLWLGIAVVVAVIAYTAAWYYGASKIKSALASFMQEQEAAGLSLECANTEIKGYPFRFELFCTKPGMANLVQGGSADAAMLRTAAQVYAPRHIVWEMDGPLDATFASGEKLQLNWQSLQSSLQLTSGGLERSSLIAEGLEIRIPPGAADNAFTGKASHGEAHIRQTNDDLEAATLIRDLVLSVPSPNGAAPTALAPFSASADVTLAQKAGVLDGRIKGAEILHPAAGEIGRVVFDFGEGRVATLSGPFSIDQDGAISGKLAVVAENFTAWQPVLAAAFPDAAGAIGTAMGAIKAMADDKGTVRVNLVIDKGQVLLGFIPLGIELPRV